MLYLSEYRFDISWTAKDLPRALTKLTIPAMKRLRRLARDPSGAKDVGLLFLSEGR